MKEVYLLVRIIDGELVLAVECVYKYIEHAEQEKIRRNQLGEVGIVIQAIKFMTKEPL